MIMIKTEFKKDYQREFSFKLFNIVISDYAEEASDSRRYKQIAELECRKIKVIGPQSDPVILYGYKNHGEYFAHGSLGKNIEIVKRAIHNTIMEKLKNGVPNAAKDNKQPLHKQVK